MLTRQKNTICQSCGMPLYKAGMYGTDADGASVEDYCLYCFKDGGFTSEVTMEEMMRLCAGYVEGNQRFYIANMRTLYPHLKRWAKKEDTESSYYESISRVLEYVKNNLNENVSLHRLAEIAHISAYHFHRIFKSVIGESVAQYSTRLRMEYVADRLKSTGYSLVDLAQQTGYSSEQALSRAFKKYFDLPPKTFKNLYFKQSFGKELIPRICKVSARNVIFLKDKLSGNEGWKKLYTYALVNHIFSAEVEHLEILYGEDYCPALCTKDSMPSDNHVVSEVLPQGLYAIFTHKGAASGVQRLKKAIDCYWLPKSNYRPGSTASYVIYLNNTNLVPEEEQLVDIYIPVCRDEKT